MEGLCRAVGAPMPVMFAGRMVLLHPLRLVDFGTIEWHIMETRREPIRVVRELPSNIDKGALLLALSVATEMQKKVRSVATPDELEAFLMSHRGMAMSLWLMFRASVCYEDIWKEIVTWKRDGFYEWNSWRNQVSGMDSSADDDWLKPEPASITHRTTEQKGFNWKACVRAICEGYTGITPEQVGNMTLYEFRLMVSERKEVENRLTISRFAAKSDPRVKEAVAKWKAEQRAAKAR